MWEKVKCKIWEKNLTRWAKETIAKVVQKFSGKFIVPLGIREMQANTKTEYKHTHAWII